MDFKNLSLSLLYRKLKIMATIEELAHQIIEQQMGEVFIFDTNCNIINKNWYI